MTAATSRAAQNLSKPGVDLTAVLANAPSHFIIEIQHLFSGFFSVCKYIVSCNAHDCSVSLFVLFCFVLEEGSRT